MEGLMASEEGTAQTAATPATADPNSLEKYQAEGDQGYTYQYYPTGSVPATAAWPVHGGDLASAANGNVNYNYQYHQQPSSAHQDGTTVPSLSSSSATSGTDNASHQFTNYPTYPTPTTQYNYGSSDYGNYYSGYQQQPNQQYNQAQGAYQNTGSPYQPISSFPNTGSFAEPTSYSSTYYNPGDYQTTGAQTGNGYSSQTTSWSQENYANYSNQYANYSQDSSSAYSSTNVTATADYQQQWADYYRSQTEVTCAPGTENTAVTSTDTLSCPIPGVSGGYATPVSQPQPSYIPHWKPEPSSALPQAQTNSTVGGYEDYWRQAGQAYQSQHAPTVQSYYQKPLDATGTYPSVQDQQQTVLPQVPNSQYTEVQPAYQTHQQPFQNPPLTDTQKVGKLHISTNPRITSNFSLGMKPLKDTSTSSVMAKPAYVSVSLLNQNKTQPSNASDSNSKRGAFPAPLRGYVERALARCKDEKQRAACQEIMKEMITKATTDGTLYSRDWDTEPLFPLPDTCSVANEPAASPVMSLSMLKKSPSRRTKSRWEPMPEEKPVDKPTSTYQESIKPGGWVQFDGRDQKIIGGKRRDSNFSKFAAAEQSNGTRSASRPTKRRCFGADRSSAENRDASSDSDKEKSLTAYYSGAVTLADSPEERKRREDRSKRFEKGNGQRTGNRFGQRNVGPGNLYSRRATALIHSKPSDDGGARAVEDIDWDSLTVKGTCQDIEKRYLRLTSAPDPCTVRPEEVLEAALLMVQNSEKNYLYKCDQLKSIRQDLTVQRIRNELTAKVYETHARFALEYGDLPEFNQCLSQLKSLYADGIPGCHFEFSAYHLLSVILHPNSRRELLSSMSRLSVEARKDDAVKHALSVRASVTSGSYVLFFRLYKTAPNLNSCLMDLCVEKMRFEAVKCMSRAYRPTIPVSYVAQVLGFGSAPEDGDGDEKDVDGFEECSEWLKAHGACLTPDNNGDVMFDAKASSSSLYMPEPEDAVAHGDANLDVNDFFTRTSK